MQTDNENKLSGWTTRALARLTGLPHTTLSGWVNDGLVTAEKYGRGRGGNHIGLQGLLELTAIMELRHAGFSGRDIRRAVENLRDLLGQERPLLGITLVVCGQDIGWRDAKELDATPVSTLHAPGQRLMVFPVGERHAEWLHQLQNNVAQVGEEAAEHRVSPSKARVSSATRRRTVHHAA